jgi:predicted Zn-dependent protease
MNPWQEIFNHSCDLAFHLLNKEGALTCSFKAEETHFIRFNNSKVRQVSHVEQAELSMELIVGQKRASSSVMLCMQKELNEKHVEDVLKYLQSVVPTMPDDPYSSPIHNFGESSVENEGSFPSVEDVLNNITEVCSGIDLAGLWTSGSNWSGNRNSQGQSHWFSSKSFVFDYSLYTAKERAVKGNYGGTHFEREQLQSQLEESKKSLTVMELEKVELKPGKYRCYLAPSAVAEIMDTFSWGALSGGSYKRGESCLKDYIEGKKTLSPLFSLSEDFNLGLNEQFNERGEVASDCTVLIDKGHVKELLVNHQSEKEYGLVSNKAGEEESPRSPVIATGDLKEEDILESLGTGLYISNLHYLNWSDQVKGRVTGMTRFGCVWVEDGVVKGPIKDLRFDETISHMFGQGLKAVTKEAETQVSTDSYYHRGIGGLKVPGMLVDQFTFTL